MKEIKITKENATKINIEKLRTRRDDLWNEAINNFISHTDFDVYEYLSQEKADEYARILFALGENDFNPDEI